MLWLPLTILLSCGPDGSDASSCSGLAEGPKRDDCWSVHILDAFRKDPVHAEKIVEKEIEDPQIQDFIWLKVTREYNPSTRRYCEKIRDRALAERCTVLVSRPHLHRDTLRKPEAGERGPSDE